MGIASQGAVATEAPVQWEDSLRADPGTGRADPGTGSACCGLTSCLMDSWFPKEAQGPEECLGEGDKGVISTLERGQLWQGVVPSCGTDTCGEGAFGPADASSSPFLHDACSQASGQEPGSQPQQPRNLLSLFPAPEPGTHSRPVLTTP